jgi:hypothetical protein
MGDDASKIGEAEQAAAVQLDRLTDCSANESVNYAMAGDLAFADDIRHGQKIRGHENLLCWYLCTSGDFLFHPRDDLREWPARKIWWPRREGR